MEVSVAQSTALTCGYALEITRWHCHVSLIFCLHPDSGAHFHSGVNLHLPEVNLGCFSEPGVLNFSELV